MSIPGALPEAAIEALARGQKIEAIRIVREQLGVGLAEAKQAVEQYRPEAAIAASDRHAAADPAHGLPAEALVALAAGHKIEAIRITREALGVGLKEAKQAVDRYQASSPGSAGDMRSGDAVQRNPGLGARTRLIIGLVVAVTLIGLYLSQF